MRVGGACFFVWCIAVIVFLPCVYWSTPAEHAPTPRPHSRRGCGGPATSSRGLHIGRPAAVDRRPWADRRRRQDCKRSAPAMHTHGAAAAFRRCASPRAGSIASESAAPATPAHAQLSSTADVARHSSVKRISREKKHHPNPSLVQRLVHTHSHPFPRTRRPSDGRDATNTVCPRCAAQAHPHRTAATLARAPHAHPKTSHRPLTPPPTRT